MPTTQDFRDELLRRFREMELIDQDYLIVTAGELHSYLKGYKQFTSCCNAMLCFYDERMDEIVDGTIGSKKAEFAIKYKLPRPEVANKFRKNKKQLSNS